MSSIQTTQPRLISIATFAAIVLCALVGTATAQNVLATIPIPAASAGQVAVDPSLDLYYAGGGPNSGGSSLTIINGSTFAVVTTLSGSAGVSVDMLQDNYWDGTLSTGNVNVYEGGANTQIISIPVGSCPAAVTFDCGHRRMWVASQCGTGNDPVWVFNANTFLEIGTAITPGGTILTPPVVSPDNGNLYVTSGGVSREINNKTFAVSNTSFGGTVLAIDSLTDHIFAAATNELQIVASHTDSLIKSATLTYTPTAMGVNNAMQHVYLLNSAAGTIDVYSENAKKLGSITLASGNQPSSLAVDSIRGRIIVDVYNTGSKSWSVMVIEDLTTVSKCGYAGSCDY